MIEFKGQKDKYSERSTGERLITFTIYQDNTNAISELALAKQGTEYSIVLTPTSGEFRSETKEEQQKRYKKRFEVLIRELAKLQNIDEEKYREQTKTKLIQSKIIKESTSELTVDQLGEFISKFEQTINELRNRPR